jgi:hypothetical protein
MPRATTGRENATLVQLSGNSADAGDRLDAHYFDCQKLICRQPRSNDGCLSSVR